MSVLKNPQEFFINEGLYNSHPIDDSLKEDVFNLLFYMNSIDCYCVDCKSNSIFLPEENRPTVMIPGIRLDRPIDSFSDWEIELQHSNFLINKKFICSRDRAHSLIFVILIKGGSIQKIGQFPSLKDLNISQIKKFKSILKDQYFQEYSTAIGLHSHGVGIGAFVYLRRIIENLIIKPAHEKAKKSHEWSEPEFQKKRIKERIDVLRNSLPEYLVNNQIFYSIVSKGIHELSEKECNDCFPLMSAVLNHILTELKEKEETEKSKIEMANKLSVLGGNLNK